MPTEIKGQPSTKVVIQRLKALNEPIFLSFSCGKDSTAAWIVLHEAGIPVLPVYLYPVPGLQFIEDELSYFEDYFHQHIERYPHPSFMRMLDGKVFQTPERLPTIEGAAYPCPDFGQIFDVVKREYSMPNGWVADGVRATDSPQRRMSLVHHGIMKETTHKVSVVADWYKGEVEQLLADYGVMRIPDYDIWGRSFDGIGLQYVKGLREHFPDDYERVKKWFPFVELEFMREETYGG